VKRPNVSKLNAWLSNRESKQRHRLLKPNVRLKRRQNLNDCLKRLDYKLKLIKREPML